MPTLTEIGSLAAVFLAALPGLLAFFSGQSQRRAERAKALLEHDDKSQERRDQEERDDRVLVSTQLTDIIRNLTEERDNLRKRLKESEKDYDDRTGALQARIRGLEDDFERMRARARFWDETAHSVRHRALGIIANLCLLLDAANVTYKMQTIDPLPPFDDQTVFSAEAKGAVT